MISRRTSSVSKEDVLSLRLLHSDLRCSETCCRCSQACRRCSQSSRWRSQVLPGAPEGHWVGPVNSGMCSPSDSGPTTLSSQWHNNILRMWWFLNCWPERVVSRFLGSMIELFGIGSGCKKLILQSESILVYNEIGSLSLTWYNGISDSGLNRSSMCFCGNGVTAECLTCSEEIIV